MRAKQSSSSCRALAFSPLLLPLLLLAAGGSHSTTTAEQTFNTLSIPIPGDQLLVPNRTHTFASYLSDATFTGLLPVFVATSIALQGTYVQDTIEDLVSGVELNCGPNKDQCSIKTVYRMPTLTLVITMASLKLNISVSRFKMRNCDSR